MTEFFDQFDSGDTQISLHLRALHYILEDSNIVDIVYELKFVKNWEEQVMQAIFDKSKIKMRMYGSAKELLESVKIFSNCPGIYRHFSLELMPYFSTPMIYKDLNGQKFICKLDLFVMLQSMVQKPTSLEATLVVTIMSFFLKSKESLLKSVEFVPFDPNVFEEISKEILMMNKELHTVVKINKSYRKFVQQLPKLGLEELFARLKSYIPNNWNHSESERIKILLLNVANNRALTFVQSRVIIEHLDKIIEKRPEMFLPNSGKGPATVRLFEDGDKKFVMKAELFSALKIEYKDPDKILDTMMFEEITKVYKDKLSNIEFIRYPIQRTKHRAAPVNRTRSDEFCYLAIDALFEWLKILIHGHRLFERHENFDSSELPFLFQGLQIKYMSEHKNPYFVTTEGDIVSHKQNFAAPKTIRNAKPDGFTVQNLKNELAYLGITVTFPEIQDHAEVIYAHVDRVKKEKYLRTCDLIDALEYCQVICIFERFPNLKKFLHNQGGCGRVPGLKCTFCGELLAPDAPESSKSVKSKIPKGAEKYGEMAENEQEPKVPVESGVSKNSTKIENPVPEVPKNPEISAPTLNTKSKNEISEAPPPAQAPPIPAPKESKNCQKCYRTCEMLNETKKELTRNEQKMKKLEKKLGEIKGENAKEIEKKDREMEEFNRKIQKSNQENEELKGKIEGLEVEKQQLEEKLGRQEQAAHESELKLTEQISLLEISVKNESEKSLQLQNEIQISRRNAQNSEIRALEKQHLEQQIGDQNQKIHEFYDSNVRLQAENEINSRMVQQLLDKLASYSNPTGYSNPGGPSSYSNPTSYSNPNGSSGSNGYSNPSTTYSNHNGPRNYSKPTTYNNPLCQVCRLEMKPEDQRYCKLIKCQQCGLKLHTSCATNWISAHKTCPSCQGQFFKN